MRTITLEEHFATLLFIAGPGQAINKQPEIAAQLLELGEKRIAEMDNAGIDLQVLSINAPGAEQSPAAEAVTLAKESNDRLALAIQTYPERFAGLAAIPTANPKTAVEEMERTIQLGFKGAVINGHVHGRYLDDSYFQPIFEAAQKLKVPIYLHPTKPPEAVSKIYYSGFSPQVDDLFARAGYGWHIETGVHVLRLILGGVFDRFPELQIIIGHLGESLPYMQERLDKVLVPRATGLQHEISYYLKKNIYYTISGFNFQSPFQTMLAEVGATRIMFSADYPYAPMDAARKFLDQLPVSEADRHLIAHGNAEKLLNL
ncbi:amidohydrolase family protein [Mucilaginibacter sp. SMC90]|uniref:amidohydrolase family protein n=1 Tax=Mucilaginibacter sp. SMC90 TaxID=2929803 RepID=UPI001FB283FD|nr:amidohydrolase family protein [Mucilaginibacter sp. SMC90]UOE50963.1 amidohydrolase family protein [Mucilaginibacter sp. SMC90]